MLTFSIFPPIVAFLGTDFTASFTALLGMWHIVSPKFMGRLGLEPRTARL